MSFCFIILAGGISHRFSSNRSKPYQKIGGKSLIEIIVNKANNLKEIKKILIVFNKKDKKKLMNLKLKNIDKIQGGKSRQESTQIALKKLVKSKKIKNVLIHDAARPNFSIKLLKLIIKNMKNAKAVIPIIEIQDAIKQKYDSSLNEYIVGKNRNEFFLTQTPQCFKLHEIYGLHKNRKNKYKDDDLSLFLDLNGVKFVSGEKNNFKITVKQDFDNLKQIFKSKIRTGIGFDIHRLVPKRKLYLGGIKINSKIGTLGHSDGDPVLHAIIDSLLGATKLGDIGRLFPDKNKKFKDIRSTKLLNEVIIKLNNLGYFINNIDVNIITQTPKIKKYQKKIEKLICKICNINNNQINIKGKSTEKLGIIGKEKAIACEVVSTVLSYD